MKIIRYVVKADTGLAPNPFHGWCTLAVCTPNHQRAKVDPGDWIVGNSEKPKGGSDSDRRLIYAMEVDESLTMNQYFGRAEFQAKKPNPWGTPEEQCGDNFYFTDPKTRLWRRLPSMFHNDPSFFFKDLGEDLSGCQVFVGKNFYYFGDKDQEFPSQFRPLIATGRGIRTYGEADVKKGVDHKLYQKFVAWLNEKYEPGRLGMPRHMAKIPVTGPMVTSYQFGYDEKWSDTLQQGGYNHLPSTQLGTEYATRKASEVANALATRGCAPVRTNQSQDKK